MTTIYILQLENNKYYIGKTNHLSERILNHFTENGSAWTKKYKPIKVLVTIEQCDQFEEDRQTKIYMKDFGIDNVRGGSYCQVKLSDEQIRLIEIELNTTNDTCYNCGESGHFVNNCWTIINKEPNVLNNFINNVNNWFNIKIPEIYFESSNNCCFRCGRDSHFVNNCYSKYHIDGYKLHKK
jgi:predicted GIY-YIG superfamily endonuclease